LAFTGFTVLCAVDEETIVIYTHTFPCVASMWISAVAAVGGLDFLLLFLFLIPEYSFAVLPLLLEFE
jgi:hypothetical protein